MINMKLNDEASAAGIAWFIAMLILGLLIWIGLDAGVGTALSVNVTTGIPVSVARSEGLNMLLQVWDFTPLVLVLVLIISLLVLAKRDKSGDV